MYGYLKYKQLSPTQDQDQGESRWVSEVTRLHTLNKFMVSFDVESLFTNIPLIESINLAVDYIMKGNPDIKLGRENLTKLFFFTTAQTPFFPFWVIFTIKLMG